MYTAQCPVYSTHQRTLADDRTSPEAHLEYSKAAPFSILQWQWPREENVNELYEQQRGATFTDQRKAFQCHLFNGSALYSESKYFCLNRGDKEAAGRPWGPSGHNLKSWMKIPRNHRMALKEGFL